LKNSYIYEVIKISWPIIIGQIGLVLTGFFDSIMVAKLGHEELAAAGISNSIFFLLSIFPMGVTMAFASITGILQGRNKTSSYTILASNSLVVTLLLSFIVSSILYFTTQCFDLFGQPPEVNTIATPYLNLLNWSLMPLLIFFFAKNICDGFSYTKGGMIVTLSALGVNVFLNWVLIYGQFGFSAYGVAGAGYATIISRIYMAVFMLIILFKSSSIPIHTLSFIRSFRTNHRINFYKKIIQLGLPTGLQYFFEVAAFAGAAVMAGWLGAKELAAHQLAITIASFTYMFAGGIAAGGSICVAKANGKKNKKDIKNYGKASWQIGIIIMLFFAGVFLLLSEPLARLFSDQSDIIKMGSQLLIWAAIFQLSDGIQAISVALLRGIEDVKKPSAFIFVSYWIIAIPVGYFLSNLAGFSLWWTGINGIWVGLSIGLTLSALGLSYRFYYLLRKT